MELLKKKILEEGKALNESILKVDSFLNHQVDANLMEKIGMEFASHFKNKHIDKIVTIESSGIAPAILTAKYLNVPLLILKKQQSSILKDELYQTTVHSFTKSVNYMLTASKNYLKEGEIVLFIDDFLANGEAALGTMKILEQAGCNLAGIGIVIEKSFQKGRKLLDNLGVDVYSLARISKLATNSIEFKD